MKTEFLKSLGSCRGRYFGQIMAENGKDIETG